nr:RNA-directed DNA polymerase, eukaryota [Tanacetum cinerariifolium]
MEKDPSSCYPRKSKLICLRCEMLEDHFDGDRRNDTIEDNADVNPSTNVYLDVNQNTSIPEVVEDLSSLDRSSDKAERLAHHNNGLDDLDISLRNRLLHQAKCQVRPVKAAVNDSSIVSPSTPSDDKLQSNAYKMFIQSRLADMDNIIDQGKGDENSKYFHGIIKKKRSQLAIRGVLVDSDWIDDPSCVKNEFLKHFSNCFAPLTPKLSFQSQFPNRVTPEQIDVLESIVLMMKLKELWDCGINKSPGPNGISFELYRKYWDIINQDVVAAVLLFFSSGSFPTGYISLFCVNS